MSNFRRPALWAEVKPRARAAKGKSDVGAVKEGGGLVRPTPPATPRTKTKMRRFASEDGAASPRGRSDSISSLTEMRRRPASGQRLTPKTKMRRFASQDGRPATSLKRDPLNGGFVPDWHGAIHLGYDLPPVNEPLRRGPRRSSGPGAGFHTTRSASSASGSSSGGSSSGRGSSAGGFSTERASPYGRGSSAGGFSTERASHARPPPPHVIVPVTPVSTRDLLQFFSIGETAAPPVARARDPATTLITAKGIGLKKEAAVSDPHLTSIILT